jgi:hypothetical protein
VLEDLKDSATQARLPNQNINLAEGNKSDKSIFNQMESESNLLAAAVKLDCLNSCLSNAGIPLYLVTLLGAACGFACAITAGLGCLLCASTVFGGALGVGASCLQRCGYRIR